MGKQKDSDKASDIPYTGALKKLFDPVHDVNIRGDVNVGKKYWLKRVFSRPRHWSLEVQKLPKESGYGLKVVVNGALPPATEPAFTTIASITVSDIKVNGSNIILWVVNASGSVANLFFSDTEDRFQAHMFVDSVVQHAEAMKEFRVAPVLSPSSTADLNGNAISVTRVLKKVVTALREVNKNMIVKGSAQPVPRGRKRPSAPITACPPAASRKKGGNRSRKEVAVDGVEEDVVMVSPTVVQHDAQKECALSSEEHEVGPAEEDERQESSDGNAEMKVVASGQLPTESSTDEERVIVPAKPSKTKKKQTSPKGRKSVSQSKKGFTPRTETILEKRFRDECLVSVPGEVLTTKQKSRKRPRRHPKKAADGKQIDIKDFQEELMEFKERSAPMYIWGQYFTKEVDVKNMKLAPKELKYRPFHSSLVDNLLQVFLTSLHPVKQTLTLMPISSKKPATYEEAKDMPFYIINGQHSWAAACKLLDSPEVDEAVKDDYRTWTCDFVWTTDKLLLSELSRRTNNANQFHWDSPEYLLHIQYARELWINYGRPTVGTKSKWKEFQSKAVETLNAMTFKNANKTVKEYPGEFRVICAPDELYNSIMNAFQWYESGDLVNPDTGNKWKDDVKDTWVRKYTVAYTFKCIRGLGKESLAELVERITEGLTGTGELDGDVELPPKVYIGQNRPKNKFCFSLKEWTDRKKQKNAVVRWLNRQYPDELWADDDVNVKVWRRFKREKGFNSAHMDELIRRATKKFLSKFMKASDNPKREQEPPPEEFLAEMNRILKKSDVLRSEVLPIMSIFKKNGKLTKMTTGSSSAESAEMSEAFQPGDMSFAGGIIDFRPMEEFLHLEDFQFDAFSGRNFEALLKTLVHPTDMLRAPPSWLVIAHSINRKEVLSAMLAHLPDYAVVESRYVPAASEKYFFSSTTLKKGNGVVVMLFTRKDTEPLKWGELLRSEERYKRVGYVREYGIHDDELRMEVYMDYISQLSLSNEGEEAIKSILCVAAGRKCMIAAVMYGLRPVTVVLGDESLDPYLMSHRIGCQMAGFEHVFHSGKPTKDVLGGSKQKWLSSQHGDHTASTSVADNKKKEIRSKMNSDRHLQEHEVDHISDGSAGGSGAVGDVQEEDRAIEDLCNEPAELLDQKSSDSDEEGDGDEEDLQSARSSPSSRAGDDYYRAGEPSDDEDEDEGDQAHEAHTADKLSAMWTRLCGSGDFVRAMLSGTKPSVPQAVDPQSHIFASAVCSCSFQSPAPVDHSHQIPALENSVDRTPAVEGPNDQISPHQSPLHQSPVDHTPAVEGPDDQISPQRSPLHQSPVDPTPAIEFPVAESQVNESPPLQYPVSPSPGRDSPVTQRPTLPVVNCPLFGQQDVNPGGQDFEPRVLQTKPSIEKGEESRQEQDCALVNVVGPNQGEELGAVRSAPILAVVAVKEEKPVLMTSNKENPIEIDSDEDDHIFRKSVKDYPTDVSSELSEGAGDTSASVTDQKVSQARALRIQLKAISKKKLAINRANRLKSRELEMENQKLMRELEKNRKRLEEAENTIRSAGLSQIVSTGEYTDSPSTPLAQQATTSIASAPELSGSQAGPSRPRPGGEDCIPSTQESIVRQMHAAGITDKLPESHRATLDERRHHVKRVQPSPNVWIMHKRRTRKVNRYISDMESSS